MNTGCCDNPIRNTEKDRLSMSDQVYGLAEFIKTCETPMTVSIQGPWGTGKTSFVNLVNEHILNGEDETLKEDFIFIPFNSWKFVQFDMSEQLSSSIILAITKELSRNMNDENAVRSAAKIFNGMELLKRTGKLGVLFANEVIKDKLDLDIKQTLDDAGITDTATALDAISELKSNLQRMIDLRLGLGGKAAEQLPEYRIKRKRVIIFVDDLDRLSPEKAVEVLEILNMFLDCEHCVFLLAVDYSVVVNGVAMKYKNTIAANKGRDFFEKMIQVVYTLPERMNHVDRYIAELLSHSGRNISLSYEFADLVKSCGKDNPRAIKRLMNSYVLLDMIHSVHGPIPQRRTVMLFATLCLQTASPELYDDFAGQFGPLYNYEKGVKWFNTLHQFCCEYTQRGCSSVQISQERLREWNLLKRGTVKDSFVPDRKKIAFLCKFLEMFAPHVGSEFRAAPGELLTIQSVLDLRRTIRWTDMLQEQSNGRSALDNVSHIVVSYGDYLSRSMETIQGTVKEAYRLTVAHMFEFILERDGICDTVFFNNVSSNHSLASLSGEEVLEETARWFRHFLSLTPQSEPEWEMIEVAGHRIWLRTGFSSVAEAERTEMMIAFLRLLSRYLRIGFVWFRDLQKRDILVSGYKEYEQYLIDEVCFVSVGETTYQIQDRDPYVAFYKSVQAILEGCNEGEISAVAKRFSAFLFEVPLATEEEVMQDMMMGFSDDSDSFCGFDFSQDEFVEAAEMEEKEFERKEKGAEESISAGDALDCFNPQEYETESQRKLRNTVLSEEAALAIDFASLEETNYQVQLPIAGKNGGDPFPFMLYLGDRPAQLAKYLYELAVFTNTKVTWYTTPYLKEQFVFGIVEEGALFQKLQEGELHELALEYPDLFCPAQIAFTDWKDYLNEIPLNLSEV